MAGGVVRSEGEETSSVGAQPAVGAICAGAVGGSLADPSMQRAHMECSGPPSVGTEFIRHVIEGSTLLKARLGPGTTMAWVW